MSGSDWEEVEWKPNKAHILTQASVFENSTRYESDDGTWISSADESDSDYDDNILVLEEVEEKERQLELKKRNDAMNNLKQIELLREEELRYQEQKEKEFCKTKLKEKQKGKKKKRFSISIPRIFRKKTKASTSSTGNLEAGDSDFCKRSVGGDNYDDETPEEGASDKAQKCFDKRYERQKGGKWQKVKIFFKKVGRTIVKIVVVGTVSTVEFIFGVTDLLPLLTHSSSNSSTVSSSIPIRRE